MEAVDGSNLRRGATSRSTEASAVAVNGGSQRMQSTEVVDRGNLRGGAMWLSTAASAVDGGNRLRQLTEAISGGEQRRGQQQRQQGGTEAVNGGLNFYYWQVSVERESKIAIFFYITIVHAQKLPFETEPNQYTRWHMGWRNRVRYGVNFSR